MERPKSAIRTLPRVSLPAVSNSVLANGRQKPTPIPNDSAIFGSGVSDDEECLTPKHPRRARTIPGELFLGCERRPRYVCRGLPRTETRQMFEPRMDAKRRERGRF